MNIFFIALGILAFAIIGFVLKIRKMPKYKISKEEWNGTGKKWFVKIRKGLTYYYLEQTHDAPGYENDIFQKNKNQCGPQDSEYNAEKVIINHRMTTVNGIEIEGE